ncbi:hypothetical protein J8L88_22385 [Aquimarina sp. MMG015]|uniref:hypothetical protein n=1 Tax=Aquimarina TaxID=290174 RepID=UPI000412542F|nr:MULTISPECIES: hypothetical protein [Aquimarina]AXT58522.1 hypothetical protein D1815_23200 [Aquimarina sp. AD1]MBQ4805628.1 hypothetical protein [Aquimarina sp. MMG015]RKN37553.1 hypothetical protein D7035_00165 [Aquimarina sp. AD1]
MKLILLSIFTSVFALGTLKTRTENNTDGIFITSTDPISGRTLMIEEDEYSIWVYVLNPDKQGIDFDGFLCSVVDPESITMSPKEATKNGNAPPLTTDYANKYSYIKNLKSNDIKVYWKYNRIEIKLKKETYLIMDLESKTSYSKALSKDCYYGNTL